MKKRRLSNLLGFTLLMASFFASCQVGVNDPSTPDSTKTGVITGKVIYENDNVTDYSGIQVTLFSTNGLMATNYCVSRGIATNARSVESITTTDQDGYYIFENVPEGVYTIYASSNSSKQKAVATNVVVKAAETIPAEELRLIATGSISGKITIDGKLTDVLGLDVFIAGTSYIAKVASDGTYEISDIPAETNYTLCVQKGEKTIIIKESIEVKANNVSNAETEDISSSKWESTAFEWLGSSESAPENPKKHGAYFNTQDGCYYIWTGEKWVSLAGATGNTGSSITWKGSLAQAPEDPQLYWAYYNTTDECSYIWTGENWDFISKSGLDGTNGSNGADGSDGTNGEDGTDGKDGVDGEDGKDGIDGIDGLSITWKGMFDIEPENPELNWAYFNNIDGCSYIYNGTSWDLLAQAGRDGANADTSDKYRGLLDLEDFIPEEFILKGNVHSDSKENWVDLPYNKMLPNLGDKITLSFNFISDQDIELLSIRFADASKAANYWLELLGEQEEKTWLYIENIKAGEEVNVNHTFTFSERPIDMVRLQISAPVYDFDEAKLTISNSKIKVTSEIGLPVYCLSSTSPNSTNITATDEGIKFSGALLSNIQDQTAKCTIIIRDTENDVQMERQYSLANNNAYESWEMVYPLVEKDKEYTFEITTKCEATTISFEKVTVTAIGGLGEYKIENIDEYEVTLSDNKKTLTRTPQVFTNNPDVPVIDYATKYDMYSNNDAATSVWDGVWMPSKMCWQSSTNQIRDLTKFDETWFTYETLESKVKGRRLGVVTRTFAKIAGYTYNDTTYFLFNDYKETFFDWDEEEQNQFLILYKNPETGEYYEDVPGTNVYYIIGEKDNETGKLVNIKFADKDTEGAIEVYGQLITFGDRIYEPAYVPATEIEDHIFSGTWKAEFTFREPIDPLSFPYTFADWSQGKVLPVYLTPVYKPYKFNIHFVDENGDELLPSIETTQQTIRIESRPPERTNYSCNYYWKDSLSDDAKNISPWTDLKLTEYHTYLYAKYELSRIQLRFLNEDGSIFETREKYSGEFSVGKANDTIYMTQNYTYTPSQKPVSSEDNKVFDHWECETGEAFTAGQNISSIGKISDVINFYPVFRDAKVKTVYFNDENGSQILDPIVLTETNSDNWNEFCLPEIPEKSGYISDGYWYEGENAFEQNNWYTFDTAEFEKLFTPNYIETEQINYSSTYNKEYLENTMWFSINCNTENSYTVYWADSFSETDILETLLKDNSLSLDESVDIKVSVYSADGKHIITDTPNDIGPITFVPNLNGTYVIKVEPWNTGDTGYYAIKVEESTSSDDPTNP